MAAPAKYHDDDYYPLSLSLLSLLCGVLCGSRNEMARKFQTGKLVADGLEKNSAKEKLLLLLG